jgi:5-hydroxyisourate hydrolase
MGGGISIHCVDVAQGRVAAGLRVSLYRLGDDGQPLQPPLAEGAVGADGSLRHPGLGGDRIGPGGYEVVFEVGTYCRAQAAGATLPSPCFLERVPYRFHIADAAQHYHLPFKFTAWGFSLFRGGA